MTQLILNDYGLKLAKNQERITVSKDGKILSDVPLRDIENVIIATQAASVTTSALAALLEAGVPVSFMDAGGRVYGKLISPNDFGDAALRALQYAASADGRGLALAKAFLCDKIANQAANLKYFAKSRAKTSPEAAALLRDKAAAVQSLVPEIQAVPGPALDKARGILLAAEGRAAAHYWDALKCILPPQLEFTARVRRGATDPVNSVLNYGYGILYARVWTCVLAAGLDPFHGFIHCYRENRPTLVFDFIEEFRQFVVDRPVFSWLIKGGKPECEPDGRLNKSARDRISGIVLKRLATPIEHDGRQTKVQDVIQSETYEIVRFLKHSGEHTPFIGMW